MSLLLTLGLAAAVLGGLSLFAWIALRNGDRPGDAEVSVEVWTSGQPDERRPVLVAEIRNPSAGPVMTGLRARRAVIPAWLAPGGVRVPFRTARRSLRASGYETVGVVPASATARFTVPVRQAARRYRLIAAIGQADRRLLLHRVVVKSPVLPVTRAWWPVGR